MKRKLQNLLTLLLFSLLASALGFAQSAVKDETVFRIPDDRCLTVAVIQSKMPIQFENIGVLIDKSGKSPFLNWKLRNNSSKSVRQVIVAFKIRTNVAVWAGVGKSEIKYDIGTDGTVVLIKPFNFYEEVTDSLALAPAEQVNRLFSRTSPGEEMPFIIVYGMVKKIVFSDGSSYEEGNATFTEF